MNNTLCRLVFVGVKSQAYARGIIYFGKLGIREEGQFSSRGFLS